MTAEVRVRYAPSPTGHLHIGGARTALFDYLFARANGGKFVIRFEDTDRTRHQESGVADQLQGLKWLGVDWDESVDVGGPYGPYRQTERLDLYKPYARKLVDEGKAYYCYCTEAELDAERAAQEERGEVPKYSGKCRGLTQAEQEAHLSEGRKPTLRFHVPEGEIIRFYDAVRGTVEFESGGIGDFIIARPGGMPMYNFAVVLDDHLMEITHVIRGEEHLSNTPRQIMLYRALGWQPPAFAHLSLILNQDRKKMSKRDESIIQFMEQYRELGYLPEAVMNFIALLGWSPGGEQEIFGKDELIEHFSLERILKSPAVFDTDKLNWMSNHYMKEASADRVFALALPHLVKAGYIRNPEDGLELERAKAITALYQEQLNCGADIVELARMFYDDSVHEENDALEVLKESHVPEVLNAFLAQVEASESFEPEDVKALLKSVQKMTGHKGRALFMTVRAAATGQVHGRDLNHTLSLLGKAAVLKRIEESRRHWGS